MKLQNKTMLITYADSLGNNLHDLQEVMDKYFKDAIGGIHLLPIFPSTGDRGFSPTRYDQIDPKFGTWADVEKLGEQYYLMFDFMINHLSKHSDQYLNYQKNKDNSKYKDLFLNWNKFWSQGRPTKEDIDLIYKRKDKAPYQKIEFADGTSSKVWNTFGDEQIDLDIRSKVTQKFIKDSLQGLAKHGASMIRLDAFAYAVKKLDTNDFFVEPEIWELLDKVKEYLKNTEVQLLPEIHEHYTMPMKVSKHGYYIYDFALPIVLLYSIYTGKSNRLAAWLRKSPMKQFTTLDTHDGIGVVDAKDILSDDELEDTTNELYKVGANVKRKYSGTEYHNLDIYQINTTYYSALGDDDQKYFLARLLQIFAPGIPQIYYVGLLAGRNDLKLLEETKEGRNINRHYYSIDEIDQEVKRPVVQKLLNLLKFRNNTPAFDLDGQIKIETPSENEITIKRSNKDSDDIAEVRVNLKELSYSVEYNGKRIDF
ncbi:sucrose phosphorylase [Lactobacillus colini]|uniref:Sucrose phosphorylase n=1 Tax=Lactobacillus colini TaxID=1819254 RepID=A0ABS4MGM8_9LACO|nr:sucrose phosphorylase [Lactobacillus colini]MBP2058835.1 sucrose phosphorylase [Lactobacillus colini]